MNDKFTSNLKIFALLLMMRKITLEVKFDEKHVYHPIIGKIGICKCSALVECKLGDPEVPGSSPVCIDKFSAGMTHQT
jgi:hypothetical protein